MSSVKEDEIGKSSDNSCVRPAPNEEASTVSKAKELNFDEDDV